MPPPSLSTAAPLAAQSTSAVALLAGASLAAALREDPRQPATVLATTGMHPQQAYQPTAKSAALRWTDASGGPDTLGWPADDRDRLLHGLGALARADGVLCCGLVDLGRDALLVAMGRQPSGVLAAAAAEIDLTALTQALSAARRAHHAVVGDDGLPDEVLITAGSRQALLRRLPGPTALGFVARLDRAQTNLALLRFRLLDLGSRSA